MGTLDHYFAPVLPRLQRRERRGTTSSTKQQRRVGELLLGRHRVRVEHVYTVQYPSSMIRPPNDKAQPHPSVRRARGSSRLHTRMLLVCRESSVLLHATGDACPPLPPLQDCLVCTAVGRPPSYGTPTAQQRQFFITLPRSVHEAVAGREHHARRPRSKKHTNQKKQEKKKLNHGQSFSFSLCSP